MKFSIISRSVSVALTATMAMGLAACSGETSQSSATSENSGMSDSAMSAQATTRTTDKAMSEPTDTSAKDPAFAVLQGEKPKPLAKEWNTDGVDVASDPGLPITAVFHNVRGHEHPDFYRVVVEFKRGATSDKRPEGQELHTKTMWTEQAVSQGKGDTMDNKGKEILDVVISGTNIPEADTEKFYYSGAKNLTFGPVDVSIDGTYEGNTHIAIGLDKKREYQVSYLDTPTRVVIDIKK